jgi:hypothetical protein
MKPWTCSICRKPILEAGLIEVFNTNAELGPVGGYPRRSSPDIEPDTETDAYRIATDPDVATASEIAEAQTAGAIWLLDRPVNIGFRAICKECPLDDNGAYGFSPPITLEGWLGWVFYLEMDKNWMGHEDTMRMIRYWWGNRGEESPWVHGPWA